MIPRAAPVRRGLRGTPLRVAIGFAVLLVASMVGCGWTTTTPRVSDGVLDLSNWDFASGGIVSLEGNWQVCWNSFVEPGSGECPTGEWSDYPVPALWSEASTPSPIGSHGFATYRVRLDLPREATALRLHVGAPFTAYRLWIDGEAVGGVGVPGETASDTVPRLVNRDYPLPIGTFHVEILAHVANFDFRGGGLRRTWYVGPSDRIEARRVEELIRYTAFASATCVLGLLFLAQFAFRPTETARGWLGFYALLIGLRVIPAATSDLPQILLGWASFDTQIRLEYLNTALLIAAAIAYAEARVPGIMPPRTTRLLLLATLALVPIQLFAPLPMVLSTISVIAVLALLLIMLVLAVYGRAVRDGLEAAEPTFWATVVYSIGVTHDIVRVFTGEGARIELFPYFVLAWLAMESYSLLRTYARAYDRVEILSDELQEANYELKETEAAIVRFDPFDLLRTLEKESIRDVHGGDYARVRMSVLHCRFHDGPSVDELVDRPFGFSQANDLIGRLDGCVLSHGGFMSGYGAGAIQVFFPNGADAAVAAAVEMLEEMSQFVERVDLPERARTEIGIGIDTGWVLIGMLGSRERLLQILSGEPLEVAPAISALTPHAGSRLLISEATCRELDPDGPFELRCVDAGSLGGATGMGDVYEVGAARPNDDDQSSP